MIIVPPVWPGMVYLLNKATELKVYVIVLLAADMIILL